MNEARETGALSDTKFHAIVGALLLLMIVVLAGLWIMEQGRRRRAEARLSDFARLQAQQREKMQVMGEMLVQQTAAPAVDREALATSQVQWNGTLRTVLLLAAPLGRSIGLLPGDVVLVTAPASPPGGADGNETQR